ncbi:MAG: histidine phosphatase family protein [Ruminococcus sp.]|nr:histidine phosphatase family protein [Ruminococcus sp.]
MRLIFVRHGEPDYINDCLTENGIIQAECTAERLRDEPITAVFSSPMGRAFKTASFTADKHGLIVQKLDFMHEIDWGDAYDGAGLPNDGHPGTLANMLYNECPSSAGGESWREHRYFGDNRCLGYYETISRRFDEFLAGFGLIRENAVYRCERECGDTVALFAHGGSGAVMFSHVLNLPFPYVLAAMPYGVCSVSVIEFCRGAGKTVVPRLELFNDMRHLESVKPEKLVFEK